MLTSHLQPVDHPAFRALCVSFSDAPQVGDDQRSERCRAVGKEGGSEPVPPRCAGILARWACSFLVSSHLRMTSFPFALLVTSRQYHSPL